MSFTDVEGVDDKTSIDHYGNWFIIQCHWQGKTYIKIATFVIDKHYNLQWEKWKESSGDEQ